MQNRSSWAVFSLAALGVLSAPIASAQTATSNAPEHREERRSSGAAQDSAATPPSAGYSGSSTNAGAQNQPRNGGATGSAGKTPRDGHPPVNPASRTNRNGATGS